MFVVTIISSLSLYGDFFKHVDVDVYLSMFVYPYICIYVDRNTTMLFNLFYLNARMACKIYPLLTTSCFNTFIHIQIVKHHHLLFPKVIVCFGGEVLLEGNNDLLKPICPSACPSSCFTTSSFLESATSATTICMSKYNRSTVPAQYKPLFDICGTDDFLNAYLYNAEQNFTVTDIFKHSAVMGWKTTSGYAYVGVFDDYTGADIPTVSAIRAQQSYYDMTNLSLEGYTLGMVSTIALQRSEFYSNLETGFSDPEESTGNPVTTYNLISGSLPVVATDYFSNVRKAMVSTTPSALAEVAKYTIFNLGYNSLTVSTINEYKEGFLSVIAALGGAFSVAAMLVTLFFVKEDELKGSNIRFCRVLLL